MSNISLVQVRVQFFDKGDLFWEDDIDNHLWLNPLQHKKIEVKKNVYHRNPPDIQLLEPNMSFSFDIFGQSKLGMFTCDLDWLVDTIGLENVFADFLKDLEEISLELVKMDYPSGFLEDFKETERVKSCNFVTAWKYEAITHHTPNGTEYDDRWDLIGLVELDNLPIKEVLEKNV